MLSHAEVILQELGIVDPKEIDLDAIACHMNAHVKYRPLDGCEARIIGLKNAAIISINEDSYPKRQRFSLAHEIGHWHHHRGQSLMCNSEDIGNYNNSPTNPERVADKFASDLILPNYLFTAAVKSYAKLNFKMVGELGELFNASKTAVAIKIIESRLFPAILVCHNQNGRKWFARSVSVQDYWFPQNTLDPESFAYDILFKGAREDSMPRIIGADAWFDRETASRYEIMEQSIRTIDGEILTLLSIADPKMQAA